MGFVLVVFLSFFAGLLFLAGWGSINLICECAPLTENVANGTMGLFLAGGCVLGSVLTVLCS